MTNEQQVLFHLSLIQVGPTVSYLIVDACKRHNRALTDLYKFNTADFLAFGLTQESAQIIVQGLANVELLEAELALVERAGARVIYYTDSEYPDFLKNIGVPPLLLYVWGAIERSCSHNLAIIGSRQGTAYGRNFIASIMPELAARSWTIVSGGARGIDAMAHESALNCGAKTIVVLGSGLLQIYPSEHRKLFDRVVEDGGGVISPFCMNSMPEAWHFPARNRIIAGLSRGVMVVQAAIKSGTRSTATFALEYGREVFAVPGAFDDKLSGGCHWLIKQGATLVTVSDDLFAELEPQYRQMTMASCVQQPFLPDLSLRGRIIALCREGACLDNIVAAMDEPLEQVHETLFALQLDGTIRQDFSGIFRVG